MSEIQAAIGNVDEEVALVYIKRRQNAEHLTRILQKTDKLVLPYESKIGSTAGTLHCKAKERHRVQRNKLLEELRNKGIGAEAYYVNPVHLMPFYRENYPSPTLTETDNASKQVFSLPVHPAVTKEEVTFIGETVLSLL